MMIEVNLLPTEMRRVEHTPLPRFMVIIIGTALVMATAAFGVVINLRKVPDLTAKQTTLTNDIGANAAAAAVYDKLQEEIADAKTRKEAIAEIWRTRIMWSRKLTQLAMMTPGGVGLTSIKLDEARATGGKEQETGGMLTLESILAGSDLDRVANWRRICEGSVRVAIVGEDVGRDFYHSFMEMQPTETTKVEVKEDEYVEKTALKIALKMPLKPPAARLSEALEMLQEEMKRNTPAVPATKRAPNRARSTAPAPASQDAPAEKPAAPASESKDTPEAPGSAAPAQNVETSSTVSSTAQ